MRHLQTKSYDKKRRKIKTTKPKPDPILKPLFTFKKPTVFGQPFKESEGQAFLFFSRDRP